MIGPGGVAIAIRFVTYIDLMLLFGAAAFAIHVVRPPWMKVTLPWAWMAGGALLGLLASAASLMALAASMTGVPLSGVDRGALQLVLSVPSLGLSFGIRAAALLVVAALGLIRLPAVPRLWAMLATSAIALATLAGVGHADMDSGALGWLHLIGDIFHLLAAALWIGAIAGLLVMVVKARRAANAGQADHAWRALAGFANVGTIAVCVIVVTGLINMLAILGLSGIPTLPATRYGRLLLAKLALFVAMLVLAAMNRFRHVPHLEEMMRGGRPASALPRLRRSLVAEAACGVAILLLVAWLGTLDPGGSQ